MRFSKRMAVASAAAMILAGCGGGSIVSNRRPDGTARHVNCTDYFFSTKRAPRSTRHVSETCDQTSGTGDPLFSDVGNFAQIVDATQADNPCGATIVKCGNADLSLDDSILADPGGPAKRGDNCTPVNGYAIGYSLGQGTGGNTLTAPGQPIPATNNTTTIVNQSQVFVQDFSSVTPVGWLLYTEANGIWFVPNLNVGFGVGVLTGSFAVPGAYKISANAQSSRKLLNAIRGVFNLIANQNGVSLTSDVSKALTGTGANLNNVPCNTTQLA